MAQLAGEQKYDKVLRRDMEELSSNLWFGNPISGEKAGNFRAVYLFFVLTNIPAGTSFGVQHKLGEVPLGYMVIGTPTTSVVDLEPGVDGSGNRLPWSENRVYLKAPNDTNKTVCILLWGTDATA